MAMGSTFVGGYGTGIRERALDEEIRHNKAVEAEAGRRSRDYRRRGSSRSVAGASPFPQGSGVTFGGGAGPSATARSTAGAEPSVYTYSAETSPEDQMKMKELSYYERDRSRGIETEDRDFGLKEKEDVRKGETHQRKMSAEDRALDKEKRVEDHKQLMKSFFTKDANAMMGWFLNDAKPGADGSVKIPIIREGEEPDTWSIQFPGADSENKDIMTNDQFGKLLTMMSPEWEAPTTEKGMAETKKLGAEAKYIEEGKGKGVMTPKDLFKAKTDYGKGMAEGGAEFEAGYNKFPGVQPQQPTPAPTAAPTLKKPMAGSGKPGQPGETHGGKPTILQGKTTGRIKYTYPDGTVIMKNKDGTVYRPETGNNPAYNENPTETGNKLFGM